MNLTSEEISLKQSICIFKKDVLNGLFNKLLIKINKML